ncbi:MAG: DUF2188 domain-containing protein [Cytophagaceae bacterium]|nr:DUF2188 domain-containing protein [Cytophagaceae bacterium]
MKVTSKSKPSKEMRLERKKRLQNLSESQKNNISERLKKAASNPDPRRIHVIYRDQNWITKGEGAQRANKIFKLTRDAVAAADFALKNGKVNAVIVHKMDGTIEKWKKADVEI